MESVYVVNNVLIALKYYANTKAEGYTLGKEPYYEVVTADFRKFNKTLSEIDMPYHKFRRFGDEYDAKVYFTAEIEKNFKKDEGQNV